MRRYIVSGLLSLFMLQSSGAALANAPTNARVHVSMPSIESIISPVLGAIEGSQIFAELTGTEDRYSVMHAPERRFVKVGVQVNAAALISRAHPLKPAVRAGIREHVTMPPLSALDPRHRMPDPLAMRRSTTQTGRPQDIFPEASPLATVHFLVPQNSVEPARRLNQHPAGPKPAGLSSSAGPGIEPWWGYEERAIPGIGKAMVNVGTGNLIVSAMDVNIPERGINLAFQRVYNSQSLHDYNGDDGGDSAIFGNLWTNTLDAHMVYNQTANTITVYDIDGAGCTYTADPVTGDWVPCAGEHATLAPTDHTDCTYAWTKKNGTVYWFYADNNGGNCGLPQAKKGHLQEILGRNYNNNITFTYSYDGTGKSAENVTEIDANHSDGHSLIMKFGKIAGTINELSTITRPDSGVLQYSYDSNGNLLEVDKPGNDAVSSVPAGHGVPAVDLPETYTYASGTSLLQQACGSRCTIANWTHPNNPGQGSALVFSFDNSSRLTSWQVQGVLNFTPGDGVGAVLQSGPTDFQAWYTANFVYGQGSGCSGGSSGTTTMCDTDGHSAVWTTDSSSRVTQTSLWTGAAEGLSLVTNQGWDIYNNLISTTDARGNKTDYAYDLNGNTIAAALPAVSDTSHGGSFRATSLYSYDPTTNNLLAYCDPQYTDSLGMDWNSNPGQSDSLCPQTVGSPGSPGANVYQYNTSDSNEPYGRLTNTYTRMGYHRSISYSASGQGGDFGLPTQVEGDSIPQPVDNDSRTPVQNLTYDSFGNILTYGTGSGVWNLLYDGENQLVAKIDPDGYAVVDCFYLDGGEYYSESSAQHGYDNGATITPRTNGGTLCPNQFQSLPAPPKYAVLYGHDADGHVTSEAHHFMQGPDVPSGFVASSSGVTQKFYDGLGRLVEVQQPYDPKADVYGFAWMTRYIYDLNPGSSGPDTVSLDGATINAYGDLYKTQECLPGQTIVTIGNGKQTGTCTFKDVRGTSFDALDRSTNKYEVSFGPQPESEFYDQNSNSFGFLSKLSNVTGQYKQFAYDPAGRVNQKSYDSPSITPTENFTFDLDGRIAVIQSSLFGTENYSYDSDGRLIEKDDPTSASYNNPGKVTYGYYPDGKRESLSLVITPTPKFNGVPFNGGNVIQYGYRADGLIDNEAVAAGNGGNYKWNYTPAGRELTQSDPSTGKQIGVYAPNPCGPTPPCQPSSYVTVQAKTYTYDSYGRIATLAFPTGPSMSGFTYDAEGKTLNDFGSTQFIGYPPAPDYLYSTRGELVWSPQPPPPYSHLGTPWQTPVISPVTFNGTTCIVQCTADARGGQILSQNAQYNDYQATYPGYSYDTVGRNNSTNFECYAIGQNGQQIVVGSGTLMKSYDAENHTISSTGTTSDPNWQQDGGNPGQCIANSSQTTLSWGNSGHPYSVSGPGYQTGPDNQQESLSEEIHWDGDQVLYAVQQSGSGSSWVVLYIGTLGGVVIGTTNTKENADITTSDRDYAGLQDQTHNSQIYTSFSPPGARFDIATKNGTLVLNPPSYGGDQQAAALGGPASLAMRRDGYQIGGLTIQGGRAYDATASQWTTPDAFAGMQQNPMSQKPFMWNGNDPLVYSDPTGYSDQPLFEDSSNLGFENWGWLLATDDGGNPPKAAADPKNGHYASADDAARAAAEAYTKYADGTGKEGGCLIYCHGSGNCGYGEYMPGTSGDVPIHPDDFTGMTGVEGFWHSHPLNSSREDTSQHMAEARDIDLKAPKGTVSAGSFRIYTTIGGDPSKNALGDLGRQVWYPGQETDDTINTLDIICQGCITR